jgi:hypothetical protein
MAAPAWRLDSSRFPLLLAHVIHGDGRTAPELDSVRRVLDELAMTRGPRVVVVDLTYALPDAARRKMLIDWTKANWASIRGELLAMACIAPGAFQRSIITGLLWFIQPGCPIELHERRDSAMSWATSVLENNGLRVPSAGSSPRLLSERG